MSNQKEMDIRAIMFREGEIWVGQCIEYDICAQAPSLADLHKRLMNTVAYECERTIHLFGTPFMGISPAPRHFEEMWNNQAMA